MENEPGTFIGSKFHQRAVRMLPALYAIERGEQGLELNEINAERHFFAGKKANRLGDGQLNLACNSFVAICDAQACCCHREPRAGLKSRRNGWFLRLRFGPGLRKS